MTRKQPPAPLANAELTQRSLRQAEQLAQVKDRCLQLERACRLANLKHYGNEFDREPHMDDPDKP